MPRASIFKTIEGSSVRTESSSFFFKAFPTIKIKQQIPNQILKNLGKSPEITIKKMTMPITYKSTRLV